ncbi:glycosyltransferase [Paracoccus alkenifer]|uniref:Glycosyltransferase, GT2 family n=1 Tax=Paracoccus alkenifer TaxID=65735 RepID=A0A1H6LI58_9RHOB|nr:glycosyltransferase [Paracoccus alkenifer]SEH88263.1 Glycosyltransferase, GT2 family [Paracoccus alkenifer]
MDRIDFALLIAGMHRSGTSYLSECCGALGLALPHDTGGPAPDNPRGHFEPRAVVALNDAILAQQGAVWLRAGRLDLPATDSALLAQMDAAVGESFGAARRIVIKDPRLSLTLPLWRAWAKARGIDVAALIALRDPAEVAQSLARRNGTGADIALLSWVQHTLSALEYSQGMARMLVPFPGWTRDPAAMLARIAALCGSTPDAGAQLRALAMFLPAAVHGAGAPLPDTPAMRLAGNVYHALSASGGAVAPGAVCPRTPEDICSKMKEHEDALDALVAEFRARHDLETAVIREAELACAAALRQRQAHSERLQQALAAGARQLAATEAQRDRGIALLSAQLTATETQRDEAIAGLSAQVAATEAQRDEVVASLGARLATIEAQRDQAVASFGAQLAATEAQRDEAVALLGARLAATEAQRDQAVASLGAQLAATEAQRDEAALVLDARLAQAEAQHELATAALAAQRDQAVAELAALQLLAADAAARRDELADVAEQQAQVIAALEEHEDRLRTHLESTERVLAETADWLNREQLAVLRPIYRRAWRLGGRALRRALPGTAVERLRRRLPVPGGIPRALAFAGPASTSSAAGYAAVAPGSGKPDIFVLSIIAWDFRTQRPQHLATRMAAAGHRVFYVEMEPSAGHGTAREVAPGVHVVRLPARGMRGVAAYTGVPSGAQARAWVDHFHALADAVGVSPVSHVVIQHPYWWHLARHLSPEFQLTFDCMDDIGGFSNTGPQVIEAERDMVARVDKMVVSSQYLADKFAPLREVALVRNGTDVSHFIRERDEPAPDWLDPPRAGTIRVGYVGAIAEWFDSDLLERVARANPDFDIHLCGAVTAEPPLRLGDLGNVTLHGEIPYADVPAFLQQMDVLIIPFQLLPIIKACDPVKFYEYSAVGRPTVSTSLPELGRAGDLVLRADSPEAFAAAIRRAAPMARDPDFGARLRRYALENAWDFRAADMLAHMRTEPRLSVVVLHYGDDIDMTLAALHAMLGHEVHPNLEVVLVDNGSAPPVLDALRARAAGDPRIVLVENGENLGFAAGNNRGIQAATGDHVLLLNNDTFLAPGALLAMQRHLQRHPETGIVGPLTNNIGNEARVEIAYADMEEMALAARALATGQRGQWTPMQVCAYFCAMFRRTDLERLGLLPEIYGRGMFEDDDHCATFRAAGLQMALAEDGFCHHHLSASFSTLPSDEKQALFDRNRAIFEDRWGKWNAHRYRDRRPAGSLPAR